MQDYLGHGHFLSQELSWDVVLRYLSLLLPNIYIYISLSLLRRDGIHVYCCHADSVIHTHKTHSISYAHKDP